VINQIGNPEVFRSKGFNFFSPLPWYLRERISLFYPHVPQTVKFIRNTSTTSNKTNRNTTNVPADGNSSKRPIVFNNCNVTNYKKKNIPENDKQKILFI